MRVRHRSGVVDMRLTAVILVAFLVLIYLLVGSYRSKSDGLRGVRRPRTLVMVPGHGMFVNEHWVVAEWMERFVPDIKEQITAAMTEYNPEETMVIFSGGQTNRHVGRLSEGESYTAAAKSMGLANYKHAITEDYARDSFENVLFSICKFREIVGSYPETFVVVGFEFKRERFEQEHRRAIRYPVEKFKYRGVPSVPVESIQSQIGMERAGTIPQFKADPYGCKPPLSTKREERNPFNRVHFYESACPEIAGLFRACGTSIYSGPLPW